MKKLIIIIFICTSFISTAWADSGVINAENVNLRQNPSINAKIVTLINKGEKVDFLKSSGDWIFIKTKTNKGWIAKNFFSPTAQVKADILNVRTLPDTNSNLKAMVPQGTCLIILKNNQDWCYVKTPDNKTGWVAKKFLNLPKTNVNNKKKIISKKVTAKNNKKPVSNSIKPQNNKKPIPGLSIYVHPKLDNFIPVSSENKDEDIFPSSESSSSTEPANIDSVLFSLEGNQPSPALTPKPDDETITVASIQKDNNLLPPASLVSPSPSPSSSPEYNEPLGQKIVIYAKQYLGYPYRYGGETPATGFDCSGFVKYVYKHFNINLPHRADLQFNYGKAVVKKDLRAGDLVFFRSTYGGYIGHVGIYVEKNTFIHASQTGRPVIFGDLTSHNRVQRYVGAKRII